ncbi:hypothetical protein DNU06_02440 [Putridiphycobacter roseus]|uniref:Uncharacterized protein n=2 Tax=Putridiphycobacter roseus TaxID=2219161 RepID=A0A2W1N313_9FLAO|nr:hypothetical protein DNU06_02440 [Putridiphycobacter roseus]
MRKKIILFTLSLLVTLGLCFFLFLIIQLGLYFLSHPEGYISQCKSVKLPFFKNILIGEIIFGGLMVCLYSYSECFKTPKFLTITILTVLLFNLGFVAYQIYLFPMLELVSSGWLMGNRTYRSGMINPLFYGAIFNGTLIIWMNYRFRKAMNNQVISRVIYSLSGLLLLFVVAKVMLTTYAHCQG